MRVIVSMPSELGSVSMLARSHMCRCSILDDTVH